MPTKPFIMSRTAVKKIMIYYFTLLIIGIIISSLSLLKGSINIGFHATITLTALIGGIGT